MQEICQYRKHYATNTIDPGGVRPTIAVHYGGDDNFGSFASDRQSVNISARLINVGFYSPELVWNGD